MELTTKQAEGLDIAIERYKMRERCTVISGYAGTGKSTLVKFIINALAQLGINPDEDVCFACYTGKACQVLMNMGNKNVSTLHKLLYESIPKPTGGWIRKQKMEIQWRLVDPIKKQSGLHLIVSFHSWLRESILLKTKGNYGFV